MNTLQDRIRGSLIGGAIGDALGYPVEFIYSFEGIQARYGERGITRLDTKQHWLDETEQVGKAVLSDDTQMTLFTANGILNAKRKGILLKYGICSAYIEWYLTQVGRWSNKYKDCWIARVPELNKRRAPGNTCMSSLNAIYSGREPMNNSKGCSRWRWQQPLLLPIRLQFSVLSSPRRLTAFLNMQQPLESIR